MLNSHTFISNGQINAQLNFGFLNANLGRVGTVDENVDKLFAVVASELLFVQFSSVSNACIESSEFVSARYSLSSVFIFLAAYAALLFLNSRFRQLIFAFNALKVQEACRNFTLNP
uniref:Uncharacterized protein n=1 Tax=Glossina austeni TaxID=7395 RepID=A0A1A9VBL9_GLOAU